jgi:phosphoribosylformimino-5-aminoimidazole carboxamide ribotide isomerase
MQIIPVIDLSRGRVVHARRGQRDLYQPVRSLLCAGSEPLDVVDGLLRLHPFAALYAADLDAIQGTGDNRASLRALGSAFPGLSIWLDAGFADAAACRDWLAAGDGRLVLGSEAQADTALLEHLTRSGDADRVILSLDFRGDGFVGPKDLLQRPDLWPRRLIAMTLARVGSGEGPDLDRLRSLQAAAAGRELYAAGGVRNLSDLGRLAAIGVAGALVASALHDGSLGAAALDAARAGRFEGAS